MRRKKNSNATVRARAPAGPPLDRELSEPSPWLVGTSGTRGVFLGAETPADPASERVRGRFREPRGTRLPVRLDESESVKRFVVGPSIRELRFGFDPGGTTYYTCFEPSRRELSENVTFIELERTVRESGRKNRVSSWKQRDAGLGQRSGASCPPKIPFIHLKFQSNYNLIMQEITRKYPKSRSKLSGEYLKILASTADEHREITAFLTEKGEEFHAIDPIEVRPQKVVIKGLPISTDIDAIRADLTERGFNVIKVAQLTKAKSKCKLPIFMVELKKLPGSPDIFQLETCCYLSIKIDSFNRRPGDCPIKTKIENPTCINCPQKGHLANSHRCPKFPKPKPKKGEASQNRNNGNKNDNKNVNNSNIFSASSAIVQKEVSFAKAVKNDKQMAPPLDKSEPAQSKPEATPNPPSQRK
ncbi:nucleic-acid-binding protein from transposon X-element [Trichonephila clavipes]|nr:nucleic-acid-binding protein from transposon X-element [Trichonephila clavipes]